MIIDEEDYIEHYGTPRHSGRYPWGSSGWGKGEVGRNTRNPDAWPYGEPGWGESKGEETAVKRSQTFLDQVDELKKKGLTPKEIATGLGLSNTGQLRAQVTIHRNTVRQSEIAFVQRLKDKGVANTEIGKRIGHPESYVRTLLAPGAADRAKVLTNTSDMLREEMQKNDLIQIGSGVEHYLGVSQEKLRAAVDILKEEGFSYDSSIFPGSTVRTGIQGFRKDIHTLDNGLKEFPISNFKVTKFDFGVGGAYFRILPYVYFRKKLKSLLKERPAVFYIHPWELDQNHPYVKGLGKRIQYTHYYNLKNTEKKLDKLLSDFQFCTLNQLIN